MDSISFSTIAASCRQAYNGVKRPTIVLEGLFNHSPKDIEDIIRFCYEDNRIEQSLSDEDLREIYLCLTDAYPEEVEDNPDLVQIITHLSLAEETRVSLSFVLKQMSQMFKADNNKTRSVIMNGLLRRVNQRDAYWLLIRMIRRRNPFRRYHILTALANHYGLFYERLKREANFIPLVTLAQRLKEGNDLIGVPSIGSPLVIPLPVKASIKEHFGAYLEVIRGERLTIHKEGDMVLMCDVNGLFLEETIEGQQELGSLISDGIYLVERVVQDDFPLRLVDVLYHKEGHHDKDFETRRDWLQEHASLPNFFKPMYWCENPQQIQHKTPPNSVAFLYARDGKLTYNNTKEEVVRFSTKSRGEILRVIGGIYTQDHVRGLVMNRWRVSARDGLDSYYEVGEIQAEDIELEKRLARLTEPSKAFVGEVAQMKGATFVEVELHHADYDHRGITISGSIVGIVSNAGFSDVVAVEDLEWLAGDEDGR